MPELLSVGNSFPNELRNNTTWCCSGIIHDTKRQTGHPKLTLSKDNSVDSVNVGERPIFKKW